MALMNTEETQEAPAREAYYAIVPEAIEASGRSLNIVFGDRLCDAAIAKLKAPDAWRTMTVKELQKLLRDQCAGQDGYLSPQQPVLETVFRLLLTAPAGKLTLAQVHRQVAELWMTSPWPRHISGESLERLLDNGISYGIVRVEGD